MQSGRCKVHNVSQSKPCTEPLRENKRHPAYYKHTMDIANVFPITAPAANVVLLDDNINRRRQLMRAIAKHLVDQGAQVWIFTQDTDLFAGLVPDRHLQPYVLPCSSDVNCMRRDAMWNRTVVLIEVMTNSNTLSRLMDIPSITVVAGTSSASVTRTSRWAWVHTPDNGWRAVGIDKDYEMVDTPAPPKPAWSFWNYFKLG
jgi:hypothetical protein